MTEHLSVCVHACVRVGACSIVMNHLSEQSDTQNKKIRSNMCESTSVPWVRMSSRFSEPGHRDPMDMFQTEVTPISVPQVKGSNWGQMNPLDSQPCSPHPKPHSPIHQDLPWVLEGLLVQLGQWAPVKDTFTALKQTLKSFAKLLLGFQLDDYLLPCDILRFVYLVLPQNLFTSLL